MASSSTEVLPCHDYKRRAGLSQLLLIRIFLSQIISGVEPVVAPKVVLLSGTDSRLCLILLLHRT